MLDYSWFEKILDVGKEVQSHDDTKNITLRTEIMDLTIEIESLRRYEDWAMNESYVMHQAGLREAHFWYVLCRTSVRGQSSVRDESSEIWPRDPLRT